MESIKQNENLETPENIINTSSNQKENKEKSLNNTNTINKSEISTTTTEKPRMPRKKLVQDYASRGLDICGVCKKKNTIWETVSPEFWSTVAILFALVVLLNTIMWIILDALIAKS